MHLDPCCEILSMKRPVTCLVICLAIVSGLLSQTPVANASPLTFNCVVTHDHCYGINIWPGNNNGANTYISVVSLSCNGCNVNGAQVGFLNNELWIQDVTPDYNDWVEVGYGTFARNGGVYEDYFWADQRPGSYYFEHDLTAVPSGDYGNKTYFHINRVGTEPTFSVVVSSAHYATTQQSTDNYMLPNRIVIGEELYGDSGFMTAHASTAYYSGNQWYDAHNDSVHYQTLNGSLQYNNPPYVGWNVKPSESNSNGGTLWTWCQC